MRAEITTSDGDFSDVKLDTVAVVTESGAVIRVSNPENPADVIRVLLTADDLRDLCDAHARIGEAVHVEIDDAPGALAPAPGGEG